MPDTSWRGRGVELRVRSLVAGSLGVDEADLSAETSLVDELAADSLDIVELALEIEQEFGVGLPDAAVDGVRTYGQLVDVALAVVGRAAVSASPGDDVTRADHAS